MTTQFIVNHLWQSSCFALLAGLLAFLLRGNRPKVRYRIWLSASLKFLVPWALLVSLGSLVPRPAQRPAASPAPVFPSALVEIAEPFAPPSYSTVPAHAPLSWFPIAISILWALGFAAIAFVRGRSWLRIRAALRASTRVDLPIPVPAFIAPGAEEPGIVGFLRPVLVLPAQLLEHLNPRQLDAVLTHELCHVRRRDNLFAAIHMLVEAIFWFHPVVWWIGSRMVEGRELACDEEVLRMGCEPADYAEGILRVCRFYTESPLPCVSGVTGADVKKRLRAILAGTVARELNFGKKAVLAAIGLATVAAPIVIGVLNAPSMRAQTTPAGIPKWEVASIRRCDDAGPRGATAPSSPGRLSTGCRDLVSLIGDAYVRYADGQFHQGAGLKTLRVVEGAPGWMTSERYDINAKAEHDARVEMMLGPMMLALLEDRAKLKFHTEKREIPIYELVVAKNDSKLRQHEELGCTRYDPLKVDATKPPAPLAPGEKRMCKDLAIGGAPNGHATADGASLDVLANGLYFMAVDRPVLNKTGFTGLLSYKLEYARPPWMDAGGNYVPVAPAQAGAPSEAASDPLPSIDTALDEVLGLKLQPAKGPELFIVIDSVDHPSEN